MVPDREDIKKFDILIRPYLDCLLSQPNDHINLTSDPLRITDCFGGCLYSSTKDQPKCDRFTLKIPYAQQILSWQVIFDTSNLKEPPDFIFDAEDHDFHPSLADINSLVCWDWQNRESLAAVVAELLEHYRDYQLDRASSNSTLQRHLRSLLAHSPPDLQIIVNRAERGLGTLNCLMKVAVDFSNIPTYLVSENPGQHCAILHVCIPYPESSNIQAQLYLTSSVENAFGGSTKLRIPAFHSGMMMGDYFANVKALLENQVKLISEGFEKRKDYIAAFINHFGKSVLEYDMQSFTKITLLWEWNDFFFTFTVMGRFGPIHFM
ncbi:BRCA1-A complex subunit BRE-like [Elysia marginata]|uniref:BRISC and BRCA1-A complex member 2 n=1 Tax=Elysia marginata TaxID=1093978 RepID=A0AAV4F6R9_9GAST|nr:BRCA1-A complex subunit BRE-like [Elysia marginata]